ncbi:DUF6376 family protein [Bacillus benzoevorans]|uniref:Lipoprotein n=1 Tax=Bacillus benzoevorans TaxID=1456 RepID=A0A7X0HST3_9BACI|nr:DUF6376 family protein [Bacillus benzoevorans]MBB6444936.1 hypothetical protein [Bacillus benzoevorans]
MKKLLYLFAVLIPLLLSGCSLLEETNKSLEYVNETTDYLNDLSTFAENAPQMFQDAATSQETKKDLENQLTSLSAEIENFNSIEPPVIAEDIHQQLVAKNEVLIDQINQVMVNGEILLDQIENTGIYTTIEEITKLRNQLEELGV